MQGLKLRRVASGFNSSLSWLGALAVTITSPAFATTLGPIMSLNAGPTTVDQRSPSVVWDSISGRYIVVWEDSRNTANGVDLYAARVLANGALDPRDTSGCPVLTDPLALAGDERTPSLARSSSGGEVVVVWTEARTSLADIFGARLNTATCVATPSVNVSASGDVERSPVVSIGPSGALVAFHVSIVGGGTVVRGRRFDAALTPRDPQSVTLTGTDAGDPTLLGTGTSHLLAWQSGGDILARSVPDSGAIPAVGMPTVVSSGPLAQLRPSLGPLGTTNAVVVWQDGRAGVRSEDIYARTLGFTSAPVGAESPLSVAANAQLFPKVAGDDTGALAIWQDRRNGAANAIIYASRLDPATGASRDADAFPVLAFLGTAFESTVAKGPADDYLVIAVQTATPYRIRYRVVRDEPPSGALMASTGGTAPADGTTAAVITFTGAVGASGLQVIDGTLYDVTITSGVATIINPDADLARPGHQVLTFGGEIRLSLSSGTVGNVSVAVASAEGTSTGAGQAVFTMTGGTNQPPTASSVVLGPAGATSSQPLTLSYVYADPDNDPETGTQIRWTRNSLSQAAYANQTTIPASATSASDQWRAMVIPSDGTQNGAPAFSNILVIANGAPTASSVRIEPSTMVRTGTPLTGRYLYSDPEQDNESGTLITWFDRDVEQVSLRGTPVVSGSAVVKGQRWRFVVTPSDGRATGPTVSSTEVVVENTPPTVSASGDTMVVEGQTATLRGSATDPDPQDRLQYAWTQTAGLPVMLSSASGQNVTFVAPLVTTPQRLTFALVVSDGSVTSAPAAVTVLVINAPDSDGDGLDDLEEVDVGTEPSRPDTDNDGLSDGREVDLGTSPLDADSDDDGVPDGLEGRTCPTCADADPGGDPDGDRTINALDRDSDGDGVVDGTELSITQPVPSGGAGQFRYEGTDPARLVRDNDPASFTNPVVADTDGDGLADGAEDKDADGLIDPGETDPNDPDDPPRPCVDTADCRRGLVCRGGLCLPPLPDAGSPQPPDTGLFPDAQPPAPDAGSSTDAPPSPNDADVSLDGGPGDAREACDGGRCTPPLLPLATSTQCGCSSTGSPVEGPAGALVLLLIQGYWRRRRR